MPSASLPPRRVRSCGAGTVPRRGSGPIWIPWVLAPLFCLAPIAGCALAGKLHRPSFAGPAEPAPSPPEVSFGPATPVVGPPAPAAPVVPIVPPSGP